MARPIKQGLEYFPMDVDADTDEALEYVIAKKGFIAFGVYVRLLMGIYKDGYYTEWNERKLFVYSKRMMMEPETLSDIISEFVTAGLFSQEMLAKGVLTSEGIQKRYLTATEKRKTVGIAPEYDLISGGVNSEKTTDDVELIPKKLNKKEVNDELTPQSKVKESKVNINNNSNELLLSSDDDTGANVKTVVEHYHARCPSLQKVREITSSRRKAINARMKELKTLDALDCFLDKVEQSDFVTGRDGRWQGTRGIDWIFKQANFLKILEGNYDNPKTAAIPTLSAEQKAELDRKRVEEQARYEAAERERVRREYLGGGAA